jgi:DNA-binding NarL/FixJ family response regulator
MTGPLRILIADDHELVRKGLRAVLQSRAGWQVCAEATNGREAVDAARQTRPQVAVMDLTMPELNGLEATRQIRRLLPHCEVLILSMHHSEQLVHEVLSAGARGYLLKSDAGEAIITALEHLAEHKPFFSSKVSQVLLDAYLNPDRSGTPRDSQHGTLTTRERQIVQLIAEGRSSKEIAAALGISEATTETHRSNLMRKMGVHSVSEIVRFAIRNKMVDP